MPTRRLTAKHFILPFISSLPPHQKRFVYFFRTHAIHLEQVVGVRWMVEYTCQEVNLQMYVKSESVSSSNLSIWFVNGNRCGKASGKIMFDFFFRCFALLHDERRFYLQLNGLRKFFMPLCIFRKKNSTFFTQVLLQFHLKWERILWYVECLCREERWVKSEQQIIGKETEGISQ